MAKNNQPDFSDMTEYLNKLLNRVDYIEKQSDSLDNRSNLRNISLSYTQEEIKEDIMTLKEKLAILKKEIEENKRVIKLMANEFKKIIKKENMDKLNEKVDNWGPERFITRTEMKNNI